MNPTRSILLVAFGLAVGSALTAVLFLVLASDPFIKTGDSDTGMKVGEKNEGSSDDLKENTVFNRDISGTGELTGTVRDSEGKGIESVAVRLHMTDQPWSHPDPPLVAKTDADGNFVFKDLSEDLSFQVWAIAPGSASATKKRVRCGKPIDLVLGEGASIELTFSAPSKKESRKVKVQLAGTDLWPTRQCTVERENKLLIEGLEVGEYVFWLESGDEAYISDCPIDLKQGDDVDLKVDFLPATKARVRVLDSLGRPLAIGSVVTIAPHSIGLLRKTMLVEPGTIALVGGLVDSAYTVVASAEGYAQSAPTQLRLDGETVIRLEKGASLRGFVKTERGDPISGASLAIDREFGSAVVSLPLGNGREFRRRMVEAAGSGWPRMVEIESGIFVPGPARMPLPKSGSERLPAQGSPWQPSNAEGEFYLDGLPSGRLVAWATHPDYVVQKKVEVTLEPGGSAGDVVVVMREGTTVTVRTTDERGYPLPDSEIRIYGESEDLLAVALTESDGYATLKGVPGSFRLEATSNGRVPLLKEVKGRTGKAMDLVLTMPPADKTLYGRVTDAEGFGVGSVSVIARSSGRGQAHVLTSVTEEDGTFSLEGAGGGKYHVTAQSQEGGAARFGGASSKDNIILVLGKEEGHVSDTAVAVETEHEFGEQDSLGQVATIEPGGSLQTQYGEVDQLVVTGPPPGKGGLPITIGGGPGRVVVTNVKPNSHVAVAGLSKGDKIIAIDGKKVTGPAAAKKAISGKIGTVVLLKVDSGDGPYTVVVQRIRVASK